MTGKPYTVYAVEGHPHARWKRAFLWTSVALVVLLLAGAGGSYLWFRSQVVEANQRVDPEVVSALSSKPQSTLSTTPVAAAAAKEEAEPEPESPSAMNILVLGSDHRQDEGETYGRSDTIILVHIDPDNDYLSLMSLPRDLRVEVPGYGMEKINAAFAFEGPALTIRTVEHLTGVDINHYLEVDFEAFKDITDALGGVYVDVDRRYYNDDPSRELIKLAPGYQLLNGADSLDYVRFRHDLNGDFGRMDRQQRFLAAMREQAMGWQLPLKLPGLIGALFDNVSTDLNANDILKLAYWGIRLDGERIRQITLVAATDEIDGLSYVVATERQLSEAVTAFLTTPAVGQGTSTSTTKTTAGTSSSTVSTTVAAEAPDLDGVDVDVLNGGGRTGEAAAAKAWLADLGAEVVTVGNAGSTGQETTIVRYPEGRSDEAALVAEAVGSDAVEQSESVERVTVVLGLDFEIPTGFEPSPTVDNIPNSSEWKALATMIPFALQAPAYIPEAYSYTDRMPQTGGTYDIEVGGGTEPALKMIYRLRENGDKTDQYMGITETTWTDAPAASEGQKVQRNGVTLTVVGSNQKVDHIWWKADGVLYWVSNTLSYVLSKEEMIKIAESMIPVPRP
jgi:polyisoprenyl-teichoic acid--peptidoglycan teichoic acid transferase